MSGAASHAVFTIPRLVRAGQRLAVSVTFSLVRTDESVEVPALTCTAKLGRERLRPLSTVVGTERATCVWRLTPNVRGRRLTGLLRVDGPGVAVRRTFARTVR